jgi:hypothetical protein
MTEVKWGAVTPDVWDQILPAQPKTKASPYDEAIESMIDGNTITIEIMDETKLKGIRIGIARRAASAHNGASLEFRYDENNHRLAVRLSEKKEKPAVQDTGEKRGPGRPKKS